MIAHQLDAKYTLYFKCLTINSHIRMIVVVVAVVVAAATAAAGDAAAAVAGVIPACSLVKASKHGRPKYE